MSSKYRPPLPPLGAISAAFVRHGRRTLVENTIRSLLVRSKLPHPSVEVPTPAGLFDLTNGTPAVSLRSKRKAGVVYKLPAPISGKAPRSYALRWLRSSVRARRERGFPLRLLSELRDLRSRRGETFRRRESVHQTALLNRGFLRLLRR